MTARVDAYRAFAMSGIITHNAGPEVLATLAAQPTHSLLSAEPFSPISLRAPSYQPDPPLLAAFHSLPAYALPPISLPTLYYCLSHIITSECCSPTVR
eukprot:1583518-Rhodomonas_salina.2